MLVIIAWLARGRALQIVTIRPSEFVAWLDSQGLPNTAAARLRYEEKAIGGKGDRWCRHSHQFKHCLTRPGPPPYRIIESAFVRCVRCSHGRLRRPAESAPRKRSPIMRKMCRR